MSDPRNAARRGAKKHALIIVGVLLAVSVPFGWSVLGEYRAHRDYLRRTLESPEHPPPWNDARYDVESCVGAGLDWIDECSGFEEFCRRSMPRYITWCLESQDRSVWCQDHRAELMRTSFGYDACQDRVAAGQIDDHRYDRQRCALAYRTAADWCLETHPDGETQTDASES